MNPAPMNVNSLLLAIVQPEDKELATQALTEAGLRVTLISTLGGFLRAGNVTLLLGLERDQVASAMQVLMTKCQRRTSFINAAPYAAEVHTLGPIAPVEVEISGATMFVLPVERYVHIEAQAVAVSEKTEGRRNSMKLVIAIVPEGQSGEMLDTLREAEYRVTLVSTTGGFWRKGNATLLIGVQSERVEDVLQRIKGVCSAATLRQSGEPAWATMFVLDMEQYKQV
jgi:uncharacterized protein YaaQ